MSWREQLKKASFKGIPFKVDTNEVEGGQRVAVHEYPFRNGVFPQPLGLRGDQFTVRAFLIGDNYIANRDALIKAVKDYATGTLILPTQASRKVQAMSYRNGYDSSQGGIEFVDMTFVEAGLAIYPTQIVSTGTNVNASAAQAISTLKASFGKNFATLGNQDFVVTAAQALTTSASSSILQAIKSGSIISAASAQMTAAVNAFNANVPTYLQNPLLMAGQLASLVAQVSTVYSLPVNLYAAYKNLLNFGIGLPTVAPITTQKAQQAANQTALVSFVQQNALVGMANASAQINFDSYNDAVSLRDELADLMDDQLIALGATGDDDSYNDLNALRAAVIQDITTRAANLARIRTVTLNQSIPALVLAYQLYQSTDNADDLVARNKVENPGFMPAGRPLEILVS